MGSEKGNSSNHENKTSIKEQANLVLLPLSFGVARIEEVLSKVRSAFAGCNDPAGINALVNQSREIESSLSDVLNSLGKTRDAINNLMGENEITTNATSVEPNQAAALSLFQLPSVSSHFISQFIPHHSLYYI